MPIQRKKKQVELDENDYQILNILLQDADTPYTKIADQIEVSGGTVHVRMKKMKQEGVVKGAHLEIDYHALGYDITAFIGIYLDKSSLYDSVALALAGIPEIVSAHYTTGIFNILAKVVCRDSDHLRDVLYDRIQRIEGIQRTETFLSLLESIQRPIKLP